MGNIKINQHDWLQKISAEKLVSDKPMVHEYIEIQSVFSMAVLQNFKPLKTITYQQSNKH